MRFYMRPRADIVLRDALKIRLCLLEFPMPVLAQIQEQESDPDLSDTLPPAGHFSGEHEQ